MIERETADAALAAVAAVIAEMVDGLQEPATAALPENADARNQRIEDLQRAARSLIALCTAMAAIEQAVS